MTGQREFGLLDGVHVLLTGGTGPIGQAMLEKVLSAYPTVRVSLLIRERRGPDRHTRRIEEASRRT